MLESTVSIAKTGTRSLRSTIPQGIVSFLDLELGDKLEWIMINKGNERLVMVTKKRNLKKPLDDAFNFEHMSI
jgi:hypothetical protein